MIKTIIFKELKELQRDTRFKIASIIVIILLFIAGFTNFKQYSATAKQYEISKEKEREMWDNQSAKNPHSAAHDGTYIFKPKNAMSLIDNGINSYKGNAVLLEAHYRNNSKYSEAYDESDFARNNKLTLNFVLLYLFPLVILLIGFNSVTKEQELDTLRLLKSQGVKPSQLIIGKWLSVFTVVFTVTLVVFILLGLTLSLLAPIDFISLALTFISYLVYYAIIISVTLLLSTLSKNSGISLVSNLAIWVLFCFVTPKIATNIANQLYPFPTKQEFQSAIEEDKKDGFNAHDPNNEKGLEFKKSILKKYNVEKLEDLKFNYTALLMQKSEEEASKIYAKHYTKLDETSENQNNTYRSLAFLSPYIPTRLLSMDLSRTGYKSDARFSNQTDNYRLVVQKFLNDNLLKAKQGDWNYKMKKEEFKNLPKFKYEKASLSEILQWNLTNLIIMLAWLVLPFILLIRYSKKI